VDDIRGVVVSHEVTMTLSTLTLLMLLYAGHTSARTPGKKWL